MVKKSKSFWVRIIAILILIPSLLFNAYLLNKKVNQPGILVIEVLDGDTLLLDGKTRLRLRHLDAPELEYCGGQQAKDLLTNLVKDKRIIIQDQILDHQGRPMALVFIGNRLINQSMIESGWVRYHSDKIDYTEELKAAGAEARDDKLGIYSSLCRQQETNLENPECIIKANIDKNKYEDNKKYYFPGCAQYEFTVVEKDLGEDWFCTEKAAQEAGFVKADTCP